MYEGLKMLVPRTGARGFALTGRKWPVGLACGLAAVVSALVPGVVWAGEKPPVPAVKIPLESLGFPGVSRSFVEASASMLTVHFLDNTHLLVTFGERKLVPRLVGDPQDDDDRLVAGEIVELPTGKVLAKTEWHMHDHARYLWALGQGRFLIRIGETLYTMAPLAQLISAGPGVSDPFVRTVMPGRQGRPAVVEVSEDGGVLTVETQISLGKGSPVIAVSNAAVVPQTVTVVDFYRLKGAGSVSSPLEVTQVGSVRSPEPFFLPITSAGYLWPVPSGNNRWAVMFDDFSGRAVSITTLDSSCTPRVEMVSGSEFVAMTCRGSGDRVRLASYGLDGTETWQEDAGDYGPPTFVAAPAAARFAVSHRTAAPPPPVGFAGIVTGKGPNGPGGTVDQTPSEGQEVRVYQNASGDLLLKVQMSPALKTAENFDLSSDGTLALATKDGQVMVYKLPALTKRDKEDLEDVAKFTPPVTTGPVRLALLTGKPVTPKGKLPVAEAPAPTSAAGAEASAPAVSVPTQTAGDAPANSSGGRKPPTLLKPGEKPEFGKSNNDGTVGAPQ